MYFISKLTQTSRKKILSPRFRFIRMFIIIYLFVLGDSLTSERFTTRTEELTKCYEPLQKLRVRLGTCKIDLSPPVIYRSKAIRLWWFFRFMSWCLIFFCAVGALCMFS